MAESNTGEGHPELQSAQAQSRTGREALHSMPADMRAELLRRSDWQGAWAIISNWLAIAGLMAAYALWPSLPMLLLVVFLLGGRQLGLAVLTHEAAHGSLFRTSWGNRVLTDWLCARPIWLDVKRYRQHHRRHHAHTSLDGDPDLALVEPFPCSRGSLWRKGLRDIVGLSGLRRIVGLLAMDFGILEYDVAGAPKRIADEQRDLGRDTKLGLQRLGAVLLSNLVLAGFLFALGHPELYGLWVLAYLTSFSLLLRIRAIAEHAGCAASPNMLLNTRTTRAGWLARVCIAPFGVNYHREHHLLPTVPFYRLAILHRWLREQGQVDPPPGYWQVLSRISSGPGAKVPI